MDLSLLTTIVWFTVAQLLQDYSGWSRSAPHSLTEREDRLKRLSESLCRLLLVADAFFDDLKLHPGNCPCGGRFQSKGRRPRVLVTTVGEVTYSRRYYECSQCQAHRIPVDDAWGVESGCLSPRAKSEASDLATALPYREAHYWLERLGGIGVSLSTLWRVTQRAGAALVAAERARLKESESRSGAAKFLLAMRHPGTAVRPVMGVDGLFLRVQREWREVKIAVVGQLSERGEWVKGQTSYLATLEPAERFRQMLVRHALDRGITRWSPVVIVSDGAEWIATLARRFYPKARHIVDYWHAKQYLWKAAYRLFGEGSAEAAAWVEEMKSHLWKGEIKAIADRVEADRRKRQLTSAEAVEELRKAVGYLQERAASLRYEEFQKRGDPTGSGPAEGGCKAVVQSRMKRSGMNWSPEGAENMLALRARYCARIHALS